MVLLTTNYFTEDDFNIWLKLYKRCHKYVYYHRTLDSIETKVISENQYNEMRRIDNQGKILIHSLNEAEKVALKRLYKDYKAKVDTKLYKKIVDNWIDIVVEAKNNKPKNLNLVDFGKRIKDIRNKCELSQKRVAKVIGISVRALCNYEKGRTSISIEVLNKMMQVYCFGSLDIWFYLLSFVKERSDFIV